MLLTETEESTRNLQQALLFRAVTSRGGADRSGSGDRGAALASLAFLSGLKATQVALRDAPFVNLNVRRLAASLNGDLATAADEVEWFATTAFDAYFDLLPNGAVVTASRGDRYGFPNLGFTVRARRGEALRVEKLSSGTIQIMNGRGSSEIDLCQISAQARLELASIAKDSDMGVVAVRDPALFDTQSLESICRNPRAVKKMHDLAVQALDFIGTASPRAQETIRRTLRWIVPIRAAKAGRHSSFTSPLLPGVVFASVNTSPTGLAEAIVHEVGHSDLNKLLDVQDLFDDTDRAEYYSPWRPDPRPVSGLFHAIYVFDKVLEFLEDIVETHGVEWAETRARLVAHRLRLACLQLPAEVLSARARDIARSADEAAARFLRDHDNYDAEPPPEILAHLANWARDNPSSFDKLRRPAARIAERETTQ